MSDTQETTPREQALPRCARCGKPFDHGCNSALCSQECDDAAQAEHDGMEFEVVTPESVNSMGNGVDLEDWLAVLGDADPAFDARVQALKVGEEIGGQAFDYDAGNYDYTIRRTR